MKFFQNVPRDDLEMVFPNVQVRMRPIDKVLRELSLATEDADGRLMAVPLDKARTHLNEVWDALVAP